MQGTNPWEIRRLRRQRNSTKNKFHDSTDEEIEKQQQVINHINL